LFPLLGNSIIHYRYKKSNKNVCKKFAGAHFGFVKKCTKSAACANCLRRLAAKLQFIAPVTNRTAKGNSDDYGSSCALPAALPARAAGLGKVLDFFTGKKR